MPAKRSHPSERPAGYVPTRIESVSDLRHVEEPSQPSRSPTQRKIAQLNSEPSDGFVADDREAEPSRVDDTQIQGAALGGAVALVCLQDEGPGGGEWLRVRRDSTVFGREQGDVQLPHNAQVSSRHAELRRADKEDGFCWTLHDLGSRNGTLFRIAGRCKLRPGQVIAVGSQRFRFEIESPTPPAEQPQVELPAARNATRVWRTPVATTHRQGGCPVLVELMSNCDGRRFPINMAQEYIGRDSRRCLVIVEDPLVNPVHACLSQEDESYYLSDLDSLNGTWIGIDEVKIDERCEIQCGGQRIMIQILS